MLEIFGKWGKKSNAAKATVLPEFKDVPAPLQKEASYSQGIRYNNVYAVRFDGEKNIGELGPIKKYLLDHDALRLRSWQLYLESEICQTVFRRFSIWIIGQGLKLQAEPQKGVLLSEKIEVNPEEFNKGVEGRFKLYAGSTMSDYAGQKNLHDLADEAFLNSIVGGDVLVILRVIDNVVKVQLIDGAHLATPLGLAMNGIDYVTESGNRVRNGIEFDATGKHIAYYVRSGFMNYERISAYGPNTGSLMAWMHYGLKYRLDTKRGIPLIVAVMETAKKMERYKEATIGSAEERQKVPFFIRHGVSSTGENPLKMARAIQKAAGFGNDNLPVDDNGAQLAKNVSATLNKSVYNMPNDSEMVAIDSKNELSFKDFYTVNIDIVCATVGIPPEVAMSKYDSNFSASRAALKDWENTINVTRKKFADKFYQNIYNLWLDVQVLTNKIDAPGYLTALYQKNEIAIAAYRWARFVGTTVPHIDPLKEVQAERAKLGTTGAHIPLTTAEAATEALNGGDSVSNMAQYGKELQNAATNNIIPVPLSGQLPQKEEKVDD